MNKYSYTEVLGGYHVILPDIETANRQQKDFIEGKIRGCEIKCVFMSEQDFNKLN